MRRLIYLACVMALCSLAACRGAETSPGRVAGYGDVARGHVYASHACGGCHGIEPGEAGSPQPGAPSFQAVANTPGITTISLNAWLQSSHPTMPNLILERDDAADVIAYILSLRSVRRDQSG